MRIDYGRRNIPCLSMETGQLTGTRFSQPTRKAVSSEQRTSKIDRSREGEARRSRPEAAWRPVQGRPGVFHPEVNPRRCEGKGDCVAVCPYGAFEVGGMPDETFNAMPFFTRLKLRAHGRKTAFTPRADACRACGLCVVACPERAIRLIGPDGRAVKAGIRRAAAVSAQS